MMRTRAVSILVFAAMLACSKGPSVEAGLLRASGISDPKSFNLITSREAFTDDIGGFVFEGLVDIDGISQKIVPCLADTWSVAPDGITWTFKLRQDVVWSDGAPFTADDVIFTFNDLIFDTTVASGSRDILQVDGVPFTVAKADTWTITVNTHKPFAPFLYTMVGPILPVHAYKDIADFNQALGINTPPEQIIGTGPFRITEFTPGQRIVLEPNSRYWGRDPEGAPLPRLKKLIVNIVPDVDAQMEWFRAGKTDFAAVRGHDWPVFSKDAERKGFTMRNLGPRMSSTYITFNQNLAGKISPEKTKWFRNRDFREAVAWAIDRRAIVDGIYNSLAYEQHAPIPQASKNFYDSGVFQYSYDLQKASALLEGAGFTKRDGKLFDADGKAVSFIIMTNAGNNERVKSATVIADGLRKLGMDVTVDAIDFNALVGRLDNDLDWDACVLGLTSTPDPHNGSNIWRPDGDLHMFNQKPRLPEEGASADVKRQYQQALAKWRPGIQPWEREIEQLFQIGASTLDPAARWNIYSRFQRIASRELPFIYTVSPAALYATNNRIQGVDPSPIYPTEISAVLHNAEFISTLEQ